MRRIDLKKVSVARSGTIRNINRQIVLNYVRERSPISRADIALETALQRLDETWDNYFAYNVAEPAGS